MGGVGQWEAPRTGTEAACERSASVLSQGLLLILREPRHQIPRLGVPGRGKLRLGRGGRGAVRSEVGAGGGV